MLAIQIDDKTIEDSLSAKFSNTKDIDKYIHDLLTKELEDTHFLAQIKSEHKRDFVSQDEIFQTLDSI